MKQVEKWIQKSQKYGPCLSAWDFMTIYRPIINITNDQCHHQGKPPKCDSTAWSLYGPCRASLPYHGVRCLWQSQVYRNTHTHKGGTAEKGNQSICQCVCILHILHICALNVLQAQLGNTMKSLISFIFPGHIYIQNLNYGFQLDIISGKSFFRRSQDF